MRVKDVLTNLKTYIALSIFVLGVIAYVFGYVELPKKVEKVESKVTGNTVSIDKLTTNIDKYLAVQEEQKKAQEKRENLMFKIIEQLTEDR